MSLIVWLPQQPEPETEIIQKAKKAKSSKGIFEVIHAGL